MEALTPTLARYCKAGRLSPTSSICGLSSVPTKDLVPLVVPPAALATASASGPVL